MKAAVVSSFDAPPRYASFDEPVAAESEIVVDVVAAGLHPIVRALASGSHYGRTGALPFIPGVDGVGRLPDGQQVYFGASRSPFGTFAERSVTTRRLCFSIPDGLDAVTAAAVANPGMSSWVALTRRAGFVSGERVLILGATGVAGRLAVEIAKRLGAKRIVAAGRNQKALEAVGELGANAIIPLEQGHDSLVASFRSEFAGEGIDVVLDYLWGQPAEAALEALSQKGLLRSASRVRFIQIGESAGKSISLRADTLRSTGVELLGSGFGSASIDEIFKALAEFFRAAAASPFRIKTRPTPLRDVEAAWNASEQGARVVLQP